jgi:DNA repair exonuclease SbcCD ATPase subunit
MNLQIDSLSLRAFRSIDRRVRVVFRDISKGLVFVTGKNKVEPELSSNGAGKSTIMDGLCWCLFGKTSTGLKAATIHNWNSRRTTTAVLIFNRSDVLHTIRRTWSPNTLKLDNESVTQERLEQFLNIDFNSFLYSVFISQFGSKFFDLEPAVKLKVFTSILENTLNRWTKASDRAAELSKQYSVKVENTREHIASASGAISSFDIEALRQRQRDFDVVKKSDVNRIKRAISEKHLEQKILNRELRSLNTDIINTKREMLELKSDIKTEEIKYKKYFKAFDVIREQLATMTGHIEEINRNVTDIESIKNKSLCPTCGGIISIGRLNGHLEHLKQHHRSKTEERRVAVGYRKEMELKVKKENDLLSTLTSKLDELESRYYSLINDRKSNVSTNTRVSREILVINKELNVKISEPNPFSSLIKEEVEKLRKFRKRRKKLRVELLEITKLFNVTELWKKGFKDIRLMILDESLKELEIQINNNLYHLGLSNWKIDLKIESETQKGNIRREFTVLVTSPVGGGKMPLEVWSGGEGQRLRLAGTLGLMDFIHNRRSTDWNIEWVDEPTQFLSETGVEDLLDVLRLRAKRLNKIIFLSDHRNLDMAGKFSAIINVVKDRRGTRIESIEEG